MAGLRLLCARPLFRDLDLQSARFVVTKACGLDVDGRHLEMGEEVPRGTLTPYALMCVYERPLARIDELSFAFTIDELRAACEVHGVRLDQRERALPDLDTLDRKGLVGLCELHGLEAGGTAKQLRQRLDAFFETGRR